MKLSSTIAFRGPTLAGVIVCLAFILFLRTSSPKIVSATEPPGAFDGTYVPDASRNSGAGLSTVPPCLRTESGVAGQGLTVADSVGTFLVGIQPEGALKIKPSKVSGKVDSTGNLDISKGMIRVAGKFDGPANDTPGHQNAFTGQLTIIVDKNKSCGYQLDLIHAPHH